MRTNDLSLKRMTKVVKRMNAVNLNPTTTFQILCHYRMTMLMVSLVRTTFHKYIMWFVGLYLMMMLIRRTVTQGA